ncbi:MAG TPA: DUF86 domain-containing protein [Syntrophobacteraceae bacterium]|nr:DUF86 domain-containing protein [Syntrophobacteraceae bacterium]
MSNRDWKFRIEDIVEAIDDIGRLVKSLTYEDFCTNTTIVKAILYDMAVIGEAARRVPSYIRGLYPEIPWREMGDLRNVVIHEYFGVDLQIVWETIQDDLLPLAPLLMKIVTEDPQS